MLFLLLVFVPFVGGILNGTVGLCDLSQLPPSWLTTSAIGIMGWSTAGVPTNGTNFCINGNKSAEYIQVAYHINLPNSAKITEEQKTIAAFDDNPNNYCTNKDPRIQYCFAICGEQMEQKVIDAALSSGTTWVVADLVEALVNDPKWAITVLAVDYNNPITHLNVSSYLDPDVWCSVYIGINPKFGFPYLLEIQLGNVIPQ